MINVRVGKPIKLSGLQSAQVSFSYNEELVNLIKQYSPAIWHKKLCLWEIPLYHLHSLLDDFCKIDQITMVVEPDRNLGDFGLEPLTQDEIDSFKVKPFQHQVEAINYGLAHRKFLLLDSMGLGKTNEIMWLAETLHRRGLIDHCFIICGVNSVKPNWKAEIEKFSNLPCRVLGEKISKKGRVTYSTVDARAEELKNPIEEFFIITNIETIRSDKIVEAFAKSKNRFGMIAIDEVHKCSNKSSQQGSNVLKLGAEFKVAATGTLITNNPINSYLPLSWTDNDQATLTNYKSQYCKFGGFSGYEIVGYQNLELLREEVESCSIRRTLDQVKSDMPPKSVTVEYLEMDPAHEKFYEAIKEGVKEEADKVELHPGNLLALTTRLRQATACPSILTSNAVESTKINRCIEIVEELVGQGEKVVVMSNFKEPIYQLAKALDRYKPLINTGDIADDQIARNVKAFQEDPSVKIFLGTHARVGTGLTLNAAMYLICIDTPFTYASFSQSCDRIYRINNTRPAIITTLVCKNTIDERVAEILERKKELGDYLVDGKMSDGLADEMRRIILEL